FQRETQWIHPHMAGRTRWILPMQLHLLTKRAFLTIGVYGCQVRNIRRWRRRRYPQQIFKHPKSADDRRRTVGIRRHHLHCTLAENSTASPVRESHSPEALSIDIRHTVMPGEPFIDE